MVIPPEQISIEDRMSQVLSRLSETEACGFEELFEDGDGSRPFMIVTFLALLEMIRLKLVRVFQPAGAGAIRVYKRPGRRMRRIRSEITSRLRAGGQPAEGLGSCRAAQARACKRTGRQRTDR
jgi:hypothetical protein